MVLIDSSVWIDYILGRTDEIDEIIETGRALTHSFVLGEIALGRHPRTAEVLYRLSALPSAISAQPSEVLELIRREQLAGTGIGYVDASLLASALLTRAALLTYDKRLAKQAARLEAGSQYPPPLRT